jgi:hypothetical protein
MDRLREIALRSVELADVIARRRAQRWQAPRRMVRVALTSLPWLGVRACGFGSGYVTPHSVMACKDERCPICARLAGVQYRGRRGSVQSAPLPPSLTDVDGRIRVLVER